MEIYLAIRAKTGEPSLSNEKWPELITVRPELVLPTPQPGWHPITKQPITIYPRPDCATVVIDGQKKGRVYWSPKGEKEVIVCGEADYVLPLAEELAILLGCECSPLAA